MKPNLRLSGRAVNKVPRSDSKRDAYYDAVPRHSTLALRTSPLCQQH